MKDKLMNMKNKAIDFINSNRLLTSVVVFSLISLVLFLVAMFALQEFVVSVCVLIIIEAAMAALLHQAEIWKHSVLLGLQLVAGVIIDRTPLVFICVLAYVAATFTLQFMGKKNE